MRRYKRGVLTAVRAFKAARPWRGDFPERAQKFTMLHVALCELYGVSVNLRFGRGDFFRPSLNEITIDRQHLSVVTYLHEFAHALDHHRGTLQRRSRDDAEAFARRWSLGLFRRVFPRQFARCEMRGVLLVKRREH